MFDRLLERYIAVRHAAPSEEGQTMAEYAVVLAVITVAIVATFRALGTGIGTQISSVTSAL